MTLRIVRSLLVVAVLAGGLGISQRGTAAAIIQPGAPILAGNSLCTLNWIYDGGGGPYAGQQDIASTTSDNASCLTRPVEQRVALGRWRTSRPTSTTH